MTWRVFMEDNAIIGDFGGGAETRYFIDLDPILKSYYQLATPVTYTSECTDSFKFRSLSTSTMLVIGTGSSPERFYVGFESGRLLVGNGVNRVVDSLQVNDGKIHELVWTISGGVFSVDIDGNTRYSEALSATLPKIITDFGRADSSDSFYFNGILSYRKVVDNTGPVVTTTFKLDKPTGNSEPSTEGNNTLTYVNIPESNRELYQLSEDKTQWDNISPPVQVLPAIIEVA